MRSRTKTNILDVFNMIPSYRLWWFIVRVFVVSIFAVAILIFARNVSGSTDIQQGWRDYISIIVVFNLLCEINILLDHLLERIMPIPKYLLPRILSHIVISFTAGAIDILYFEKYLGGSSHIFQHPVMRIIIVFGMVFIAFIILIALTLRISAKWINSQSEIDKLKQDQLKNDYNALQDQLNPHFLFNNLSVLKSLIMYDKEGAIEFTQNFTDVYRYVLQCKDKTTMNLGQELEFILAYLGLHKERLGEGLSIDISVDKEMFSRLLPPLSLQLLVENAIKHNVASIDEPLHIEIKADNNNVVVTNRKNLKVSGYSTHTGLKNLNKRYELLSGLEIKVNDNGSDFIVQIPLLNQ